VFPVRYDYHIRIESNAIPVTGRRPIRVFPVRYEHNLHIIK
jgi:hypothetical protein